MKPPVDFTFPEAEATCRRVIDAGGFIVQKWTCSGCKDRLYGTEPNVLTERGHCPKCNTVTDIRTQGCGFMLIQQLGGTPVTIDQVRQMINSQRGETLQ